jgi:hypothetical protein
MLIIFFIFAAYFLNPKYQYANALAYRVDLLSSLKEVLRKLEPDIDTQVQAFSEVKYFTEQKLGFGEPDCIRAIELQNPSKMLLSKYNTSYVFTLTYIPLNPDAADWWMVYGTDAPTLRRLAVRILSQTASASGCERNWSTFNLVHSKRRNRLGTERLNDLVYVHYNMRLRMKHIREGEDRASEDPIDLAYIYCRSDDEDPIHDWLQDNGDPVLDETGSRPDPRIAREMGVDVEEYMSQSEPSRGNTPGLGGSSDDSDASDDNDDATHSPDDDEGGDEGDDGAESVRQLSPFTGEQGFTHATQDDDHGGRNIQPPYPRHYGTNRRKKKNAPADDDPYASQSGSNYFPPGEAILQGFDAMSVVGSDQSNYGGSSYHTSDRYSDSTWSTRHTGSSMERPINVGMGYYPPINEGVEYQPYQGNAPSDVSSGDPWDYSSMFGHPQAPPPEPVHEPYFRYGPAPADDQMPRGLAEAYPAIGWLSQLPEREHYKYIMQYTTYYSHMDWMTFVAWKGNMIEQGESEGQYEPSRHSTWY